MIISNIIKIKGENYMRLRKFPCKIKIFDFEKEAKRIFEQVIYNECLKRIFAIIFFFVTLFYTVFCVPFF